MRNYDTGNGQPYPRIVRVEMALDEAGNGTATYTEKMACFVTDGGQQRVVYLEGTESRHQITIPAAQMLDPVQLVNPATGADIPGTTNGRAFYLSALAIIRAHQVARDQAAVG